MVLGRQKRGAAAAVHTEPQAFPHTLFPRVLQTLDPDPGCAPAPRAAGEGSGAPGGGPFREAGLRAPMLRGNAARVCAASPALSMPRAGAGAQPPGVESTAASSPPGSPEPPAGGKEPGPGSPCSRPALTSTLMFSFCERRERTSSTSRLKMAWTKGGCRESQRSGNEPERNPGGGVRGDTRRRGGASLEGLRSGVLAAGGSCDVSAGRQDPKDTGSVEGSAAWGGAGAPGSGPA